MGPRAGLHGLEKRKVPYLFCESNHDSSTVEPLAKLLSSLHYHDICKRSNSNALCSDAGSCKFLIFEIVRLEVLMECCLLGCDAMHFS
jgi:hypothetical protein